MSLGIARTAGGRQLSAWANVAAAIGLGGRFGASAARAAAVGQMGKEVDQRAREHEVAMRRIERAEKEERESAEQFRQYASAVPAVERTSTPVGKVTTSSVARGSGVRLDLSA